MRSRGQIRVYGLTCGLACGRARRALACERGCGLARSLARVDTRSRFLGNETKKQLLHLVERKIRTELWVAEFI